jgi:hypothetical protein
LVDIVRISHVASLGWPTRGTNVSGAFQAHAVPVVRVRLLSVGLDGMPRTLGGGGDRLVINMDPKGG